MSMSIERKKDFTRICAECAYYNKSPKSLYARCLVPVDLVSGRPAPVACVEARGRNGHCGPEGKRYESAVTAAKVRQAAE